MIGDFLSIAYTLICLIVGEVGKHLFLLVLAALGVILAAAVKFKVFARLLQAHKE